MEFHELLSVSLCTCARLVVRGPAWPVRRSHHRESFGLCACNALRVCPERGLDNAVIEKLVRGNNGSRDPLEFLRVPGISRGML